MGILIVGILLILLLGGFMVVLGYQLLGLLLMFLVAGAIGAGADALIPGRLPGGWLGAVVAGILGGFVGNLVLRPFGMSGFGPGLFGIDLIPAFVGAVVITALAELLTGSRNRALPPGRTG
jgi:uncharacterized membrane protein YeaQ/YmgE (transglycosylase-associated protein family)